jgi:glycosyltransferase involved in cell wall biosynthesis
VLLTVSEYSKRRISHHFGIQSSEITVTPNAISDITHIASRPIGNLASTDFYLFVSRFEPRKNQHLLVKSFINSSANTSTKLVLVGSPAIDYPELEALMKGEHKDRIVHLQSIDMSELVWLYKNSKASIYPSKCEGFGIPPLEAVALGCPSYCTDNTALSELKDYVDGVFNESESSITSVINRIEMAQPVSSSRNREKVLSTFDWENSAQLLIERLANEV